MSGSRLGLAHESPNLTIHPTSVKHPRSQIRTDIALRKLGDMTKIPKIIHQSWIDKNVPRNAYPTHWQESWTQLHPDWEYLFWTDQDNRNLVRDHYPRYLKQYDSLDLGIKRADFCRFLYMHKYGGLYVDLDFISIRNQSPMLENADLLVGSLSKENPHYRIPNAYLASRPDLPFWLQLADDAMNAPPIEQSVETFAGPFRLQWGLEKYRPAKLRVLPQELVYPFDWIHFTHWNDGIHFRPKEADLAKKLRDLTIDEIRAILPESFAVTTWSHNW